MPLLLESKDLPLLRLTYLGDYTDAELETFLRELERILERPGRKVCLIDLTSATPGSARQRQMQASWIATHEKQLKQAFAAAAIVTDSAIIRGTVTAVFWIRPLPFPTDIVATVEQAHAWLAPYMTRL